MKKLFILLVGASVVSIQCSLRCNKPNRFVMATREKVRLNYYPDISIKSEEEHQTANRCFGALCGLEFYPYSLNPQSQPKVTFRDATGYCERASMYQNIPRPVNGFRLILQL